MTAVPAAEARVPSIPTSPSHRPPAPTDRIADHPVAPLFLHRWSPRAFTDEPVTEEEAATLFEAARWAPSSANEQPWLFVYARRAEDRARFLPGLVEFNQMWANRAPLLAFLFARKFARNTDEGDRPNPSARFDAGAAWMSVALQAKILGLSAHAMAGIDHPKVFQITGVPEDQYDLVAAIAVGHRGAKEQLAAPFASRETPSGRLPLRAIANEGRFAPAPATP